MKNWPDYEVITVGKSYLIPVASPLHNPEQVSEVLLQYLSAKLPVDEILGLITTREHVDKAQITADDLAVVAPITGGTEELIVELAGKARFTLILPHNQMNSLPASLEAYSMLRLAERPATLIAEWPLSQNALSFINAWRTVDSVGKYVLGIIGEPSPWLVYSATNEVGELLRQLLPGLRIVRINMNEVIELFTNIGDEEVAELTGKVIESAVMVRVSSSEVRKAIKLYVSLKRLIARHGLKALTIRCFDLIRDLGTTACLALSLLNSEGLVAGCEGDLSALVTMAILKELTKGPVFMGNISWVEREEILITHCSIALGMTCKYGLDTHFESGVGVGIAGHIPRGSPVTLVKLDPLSNTLRIIRGTVIDGEPLSSKHCRTQLKVKVSGGSEVTSQILSNPIGNHYVLALGDYELDLRYVAEITGLIYEDLAH